MNFLIDGGVRLAAFVAAGLYNRQALGYLPAAVPIAGAGLFVGGRIQAGLSQRARSRSSSACCSRPVAWPCSSSDSRQDEQGNDLPGVRSYIHTLSECKT